MSSLIKIKYDNLGSAAFVASLLFHILIFFAAVLVVRFSQHMPVTNGGYVEVVTSPGVSEPSVKEQPIQTEKIETIVPEKTPVISDETPAKPDEIVENKTSVSNSSAPANITFNSTNTDTSSLNNIYAESTLDVRIKYPAGWTYIDQNVKNKLDGVTFIATQSSYNPPPYVHLSVMDKYLFNERRYKYKIETYDYTAYYNDPEELAGQVEQVFYLRTETDEDYSIKFIMKGKDNFLALQPTFFGMVKTFKFGNSLF